MPFSLSIALPLERGSSGGLVSVPPEVISTYLLKEDFLTAQAAYGDNLFHDRNAAPGPGIIQIRNAPTSTVSSNVFHVTDANIQFRGNVDRARLAGRMHKYVFALRSSGTVQSYRFGLARVANLVEGPYYPSFEGKIGALRMNHSTAVLFCSNIIDAEPAINSSYEYYVIERAVGAFMVKKIGEEFHILCVDNLSNVSSCLGVEDGSATSFAEFSSVRTANSIFDYLLPVVSDSFNRANSSTIGDSDGLAVEEIGGEGVSPTEAGNNLEISSALLQLSEDGTGYLTWESDEVDIHQMAQLKPIDGSPVGLVYRYVDADNCWILELNSTADTMTIRERTAGVETVRKTSTWTDDGGVIASGTLYNTHVNTFGNIHRGMVTGLPAPILHVNHITHTSAVHNTATRHGIRIKKGAAVNSAQARNYACWPRRIARFPIM